MRRTSFVAVLVLAGLAAQGCVIDQEINNGNPLGALIRIFALVGRVSAQKAASQKVDLPVDVTGSIGGLSGTFSLTLGSYGTFGGTATIGRDRKSAKLKAEDTEELKDLVHAVLVDAVSQDVTVNEVKLTASGRQTTGGVKKSWNVKIKYKGVVASGPDIGRSVKGTLKSKGSYE
jgi:hypothetical protein